MPRYNGSSVPREKLIPLGFDGDVPYFLRTDALGVYRCVDNVLCEVRLTDLPVHVMNRAEREFGYYEMADAVQ